MIFVILSACNGELLSKPIRWHAEEPSIRMPLMKSNKIGFEVTTLKNQATTKILVFEHSGKHAVLENGQTAAIYELTDFIP